ncbi:MAG: AbrB family transcriptional regulator [Kiloniellales bacterium]
MSAGGPGSEAALAEPPVRLAPSLRSTALALAVGIAGGWLAFQLRLPLPWMIGAMSVTTAAAALGAPITMPLGFRQVMVAVLGTMLGSGFSPEMLAHLGDWALSLCTLALYGAAAGGAGLVYFRRLWGYDPVTAYFAAMPGGLAEMTLVGAEMGGDARIISLTHASRVLLVVLALPFAFQVLIGYDPGARPAIGLPLAEVAAADLAILAGCGALGFVLARALRLPAAAVVGPMILSGAVHLAGWTSATPPFELVAAAQVVIGTAIGCRFAGVSTRLLSRTVVAAAGGTVVLLSATIAFALALAELTGLPVVALMLAFSPGGLAEMSLIAIAIGADAAFVATHHVVRIFLIVVLAPLAFRVMKRRRGDTTEDRGV